jgi:GDP-L-fucose synthase
MKLVTGGTGLIGSQFTDAILVSSKDYNLLDEQSIISMLHTHNPDTIVHTAALVGGIGANTARQADFYYQNIKMNSQLIHQSMLAGVKRLICFSSTCVFPDKVEYPLTEDKMQLGPPHNSNYGYAYAKRMVDVQLKAYNEQYNTNYFTVIPTNVYGPNDNFNLDNSHVVPALIHKVYLAKESNSDLEVWGTGEPLREFIYSKDVADICNLLLDKQTTNNPVIVSTSQEISIKHLVYTICDLMKFQNKIVFNNKMDGQLRKPTNTSYLKSIIGDYKFTTLTEGLGETIEWFQSNYNHIRK